MTAPSIAKMTEIAHLGAMELNKGGKVPTEQPSLTRDYLYCLVRCSLIISSLYNVY